ncbi:MAG: DUF6893 family small protein [Micromonosporaceae bacterium]
MKRSFLTLLLFAGIGAVVAVQWPEIQRYLKITRM